MPIPVLLMARELDRGGSERQMTQMALSLDRTVFSPRVGCFIANGPRTKTLEAAGIPVVQFPVRSFKSPSAWSGGRQLVRYLESEQIRLVHTFDYVLNVFAIPITRAFSKAVAVSSQRSHRDLVNGTYRKLLRASDRLAHAIVVNCRYLERHMLDDEHVNPERLEVCYNGIELDYFTPAGRTLDQDRPFTIGTVSGLHRWKGLSTLLEAFAQVRSTVNVRLLIVGDGIMLDDLKNQARALGIGEQVTFEPASQQVPEVLRRIDIFVQTSLSEALSNALMEAMACGCSVVASNVGGNPELVQDGQTGLLFEPGNASSLAAALRQLLENEPLRRELASAGLCFIRKNFSLEASARRMGEIYGRLTSAN